MALGGFFGALAIGGIGYAVGQFGSPAELMKAIEAVLKQNLPGVAAYLQRVPGMVERLPGALQDGYFFVVKDVGLLRAFGIVLFFLVMAAFMIELLIKPFIGNFKRLLMMMGFIKGQTVAAPVEERDQQAAAGKIRKSQQRIIEERAVAAYLKEQQRKMEKIKKLEEQLAKQQGKEGVFKGKARKLGSTEDME